MSVIAYIRKSTDKQSFEHQEYEIKHYAQKHNLKIDRWVEESISSRKELKKRQLGKLLEELQDGDILIATEISRLGRSLLEVMGILQTCLEKNCQVITIKENYHLGNDIQSQVLGFAFGLSSQICADTVDALIRAVNDKLKKGWKLQGGVANLISTTGYMVFYQAIYKVD